MKIEIKHRITGAVLFAGEGTTKEVLQKAVILSMFRSGSLNIVDNERGLE